MDGEGWVFKLEIGPFLSRWFRVSTAQISKQIQMRIFSNWRTNPLLCIWPPHVQLEEAPFSEEEAGVSFGQRNLTSFPLTFTHPFFFLRTVEVGRAAPLFEMPRQSPPFPPQELLVIPPFLQPPPHGPFGCVAIRECVFPLPNRGCFPPPAGGEVLFAASPSANF